MNLGDPIIDGYLEYSSGVRKLKRDSVRDIKCTIGKLQKYLLSNKKVEFIWELELDDFISYINFLREKGERGTGISKQISQLRSFIDYCHKIGYATKNPLYGFEVKDSGPRYEPRYLTIEEVTKLIGSLSKSSLVKRKERLIVLMLYGLGLRTSELCNLKVKNISIENQDVYVKGKFDIERRIPVPDGVWVELLAYLQERELKRGYVFKTDHKKTKLDVAYVGNIVKSYARISQLDGVITPKTLRHTFASHLMDKGVDIGIISSLMGHKSPRETGVYLHAFNKNKKDVIVHFDDLEKEEE